MMNTRTLIKLMLGILLVVVVLMAATILAIRASQTPALVANQQGSSGQLAQVQENAISALGMPIAHAQMSYTFDLCASDGTITLPDSTSVTVWGFVDTGGGPCTTGLVTSLPGPELRASAGDDVTINLTNALTENVSILISGQNVAASGTPGTFTKEAIANNGGGATYSFTAQEGTYLYESGTNPSIQIPMGLYGALIVDSGVAGQAYGYAFNQEAVLLLSEIDPNLNANPAGFNLLNYKPTYWLINGAAYPDTAPITANPGDQVLLRYLNAGFDHPSMTLLGAYQRVIAKEAYPLTNPFDVVAETIPAGTTADMIVDTGFGGGSLALYNRNLYVTNGDAYPGGMLMFISTGPAVDQPPVVNAGPDQMIALPSSANLNGTVIDDGLSPLTTLWSMTSGPGTVTFGDASLVDTTASFSVEGDYVLRLMATDGTGSVFDEVTITVNTAPVDQPPTVSAGTDQTITLPASANLDGTVTDDGLSPLTTLWSMTSGPGTVTFGDAGLVDTTASFSVDGVYVLRLTATDGTGSVFDEVTITVNPVPALTMHIGAMSGSVTDTSPGGAGGGTYTVDVIITVHNASEGSLSGVTVSGSWTSGAGGFDSITSSCMTDTNGQCTVQAIHNLNPNNTSNNLIFTVNSLTLASYTYVPADNDVPNSVTVPRP